MHRGDGSTSLRRFPANPHRAALAELPFRYNTSDFHFDTEIIIQLVFARMKIVEVPIPTYYGDEICHVEGVPYALNCIATVLRSRANRFHLVYHPKFDVFGTDEYVFKEAPNSVHQHVLRRWWAPGTKVLELGAGHGRVGRALHSLGVPTRDDLQALGRATRRSWRCRVRRWRNWRSR